MRKYIRKVHFNARDSVTVSVSPHVDGTYAVRETNRYSTSVDGHDRYVAAVTVIGDYVDYHEAKAKADSWFMDNVA